MLKVEREQQKLVLKSGSTTVVLDKGVNEAILERKLLFWSRKPVARPLSSIAEAKIETNIDPASRAETCSVMLRMREGGGWVLGARDKQNATAGVDAICEFLGIA
jgi:hypothetical protein